MTEGFGSPKFMREQLTGLVYYIVSQYKLADEKNAIGKPKVDGYINREIYRRALYDERFQLEPETENTFLLTDVAYKKGCKAAFTDWYKETTREYRVFNMGVLYGISLLEYIQMPSYIQEVLLEDAKDVKRQEPKGSDAMMRELNKSSLFTDAEINKLRL